jgi:hypothetical protein
MGVANASSVPSRESYSEPLGSVWRKVRADWRHDSLITRQGGSLLRPAQVQCVLGIRYFLMRGTLVHAVGFPSGDGILARSGTVTIATKAV